MSYLSIVLEKLPKFFRGYFFWRARHVHIKKLSFHAAVVANSVSNCINARVSDRWICSIIRHSMRFSSIEAPSAV